MRIAAAIMIGLIPCSPFLILAIMEASPLRDKVLLETPLFCAFMAWLAVPDMLREARRMDRKSDAQNPYRAETFFRIMSLVLCACVGTYLVAIASTFRESLIDQYVVVFLYINPIYICALYFRATNPLPPGYTEHDMTPQRT